ncbi:Membrane protein [Mycobacterium tuberculosis variant bovis]|nr:membrane protein [Mycobacterium tuberculosis EAI5]ESK73588.1 membrane protein [Mycobacterium tuberculosis variant bovis AN5]ESK77024.1 membrane protein [Mycobacterium tuberculosis variant bovis 04-303]CEJ30255.1 Membrane protein [Mycobacterium tuberculosis variant bovis]CEJ49884.1 Membrane protein [Mycobacterium tuberculosis variant caprae]CFR81874.1 transmembrane protein [Mycobacterium tuberculosis]
MARGDPPMRSISVTTMTRRLRPGWLVALSAAVIAASTWMPWLTTTVGGGGWVNAIGGTHGSLELPHGFGPGQLIVLLSSTLLVVGAMAGRGLSVKLSSIAALVVSLLIVALTVWYYKLNVNPPVSAEYGLYFGAAGGVCAVGCSLWAAVSAASPGRRRHREVVR